MTDSNDLTKQLQLMQSKLAEDLKALEEGDPVLLNTTGSSELGTDSWEADVHAKSQALKFQLSNVSAEIKNTIAKIKSGSYGICERCGKQISAERLKIMPYASKCTLCL